MNPDPVRNLGPWSFTLQQETPVHWLRSGTLESYLLRMQIECPLIPGSLVSTGIMLHSGDDILGGGSIWMEIKDGKKVYCLGGNDLASRPVLTKEYPVKAELRNGRNVMTEDWEVLMQGYSGCIFFDDRKIRIKFKLKRNKGAIAFFNSSQSPVWENPDAFDQIFSGLDVVFRNINITAVCRKVELDSYLARPNVICTEPVKQVQRLMGASEEDTQNKIRGQSRFVSRVLGGNKQAGDRPQVGDVNVENAKLKDVNLEQLEGDRLADEEKIANPKRHPVAEALEDGRIKTSSVAGPVVRSGDQHLDLMACQGHLLRNMGESVLYSKPQLKKYNQQKKQGASYYQTALMKGARPKRRPGSRERACPLSEDELRDSWRSRQDTFLEGHTDLIADKYEFGEPPKARNPKGQHIRHKDQPFDHHRPVSQERVKKWEKTLAELRKQPAAVEIPESELLGMRNRIKTQLENCGKRLAHTRELLAAVNKKKAALTDKHPREAVQHVEAEHLKLEQQQHNEMLEEISYMDRIREIDIEIQDLREEKPSVKELLPESLRKVLEADEKGKRPQQQAITEGDLPASRGSIGKL